MSLKAYFDLVQWDFPSVVLSFEQQHWKLKNEDINTTMGLHEGDKASILGSFPHCNKDQEYINAVTKQEAF